MSDLSKTRASLILRLKRPEDALAWEEFVEIYQPLIFRLARQRGLQEADALDLVQEVMTRVARAIDQFDPDPERGSFRGWISRISRNLSVEFLRARSRQPLVSGDSSIEELINTVPSGEASEQYDREHEKQLFLWAADKIRDDFQPRTWQAFWRTAVEHRPVIEVAQQLDVTPGAVYIARSRVMARLKQKIQQQMDAESGWIPMTPRTSQQDRS